MVHVLQNGVEGALQMQMSGSPTTVSEFFHFSVATGTVSSSYLSSGLLLVKISVLYICLFVCFVGEMVDGGGKPACFCVAILELETPISCIC